MIRLLRGLTLSLLNRVICQALSAGAFCICIHIASPAVAQDHPVPQGDENAPARWRAGEAIVTESPAAADGWFTLDCQGSNCALLFDTIVAKLPPEEQRRVDGRLQLRASWGERQLIQFGPFFVPDGSASGRLVDVSYVALSAPWFDAGYAELACNWQNSGGDHLLELAGGPAAIYTAPDSRPRPLVIDSIQICNKCRAMPILRLTLSDAEGQALHWEMRSKFGKEGHFYGVASWNDQKKSEMECKLR